MTNAVAIAQSGANNVTFRNRIINGDFRVSQYNGTSSVTLSGSSNVYPIDRFAFNYSQTGKLSVQQNMGSVTPPAGFSYYLGVQCAATATVGANDYFNFQQRVEGLNAADLNWGTANAKTVTLSFWVYTNFTGTYSGSLVQNYGSARSYPFTFTVSSSNTWTQIVITIPGDTSGTYQTNNGVWTQIVWSLSSGSTYSGTANTWSGGGYYAATGALTNFTSSTSNYFYVTGIQFEAGTTASPFEYRQYGTELALCQRYYAILLSTAVNQYQNVGSFYTASSFFFNIKYPVNMRANPTITNNSATGYVAVNGAIPSITVWGTFYPSTQNAGINVTAGGTAGYAGHVDISSGSLTASAEL